MPHHLLSKYRISPISSVNECASRSGGWLTVGQLCRCSWNELWPRASASDTIKSRLTMRSTRTHNDRSARPVGDRQSRDQFHTMSLCMMSGTGLITHTLARRHRTRKLLCDLLAVACTPFVLLNFITSHTIQRNRAKCIQYSYCGWIYIYFFRSMLQKGLLLKFLEKLPDLFKSILREKDWKNATYLCKNDHNGLYTFQKINVKEFLTV